MAEFEQCPSYTIEDAMALWRAFHQTPAGQASPAPRDMARTAATYWLILVVGVLMLVLPLIARGSTDPVSLCTGLLFLVLGVYALRECRAEYPRWVRKTWDRYQKGEPRYTFRFEADHITISDSASEHRYEYSLLRQLWMDGGHFYLSFQDPPSRQVHILNRNAFTRGDPARFAAFLEEKTGRKVRWVNGVPEEVAAE